MDWLAAKDQRNCSHIVIDDREGLRTLRQDTFIQQKMNSEL